MARNKTVTAVSPRALADALEHLQEGAPIPPDTFAPLPTKIVVPRIRAAAAPNVDDMLDELFGESYPLSRSQSDDPADLRHVWSESDEAVDRDDSANLRQVWSESDFAIWRSRWDQLRIGDTFPRQRSDSVDGGDSTMSESATASGYATASENGEPSPGYDEAINALMDFGPFTAQAATVTVPNDIVNLTNDHGPEQLIYGLRKAFSRDASAAQDAASFCFSGTPPQADLEFPASFSLETTQPDSPLQAHSLDGILSNTVPDEELLRDEWFSSFSTFEQDGLGPRQPAYALNPRVGIAQPKEEQETDKEVIKKVEDISPFFICIAFASGKPMVPYTQETVAAIGNMPASRFATAIRISSRLYQHPQLELDINVCYGTTNVKIASVSIPLDSLVAAPRMSAISQEQVESLLASQGFTEPPQNGAFLLDMTTNNENVEVIFQRRAMDDLHSLHMPGLMQLRNSIEMTFSTKSLQLTFLVTKEWEDFDDWSLRLGQEYANSLLDPTASLKTAARGQPITIRNYVADLPEEARKLPAHMAFRDVDDMLTSLGDGAAREHAYEKWATSELNKMDCKALMMPIGTQTCTIKRDGKEVEVPYLYHFSILKTSNDEQFAQLVPPINAMCKVQVQVPYTKVPAPMDNKSEKEIVGIIAKAMHNQLWSHRVPYSKDKANIEQRWVDAYTEIIKPFVVTKKFNDEDELVHAFAYMLSQRLQKRRADKESNTKGETPKEHRTRTTEEVNKYRNHLMLPADTTADIPQFTLVRMSHDDPLDKLSDFQFIAYRPKQMGWPKKELAMAAAPFLDFKEPRLPKHNGLDELVKIFTSSKDKAEKFMVDLRFVEVDDDITAKSKVQGLLKMKEFQNTPLVQWFSTFRGNPITTDVTQSFSVLSQAMHRFYYDPALPFHESDDVQDEHEDLFYPATLRDASNKIIAITTPEFQRREAIVVQRVLEALHMFSEDQRDAFIMLTKAPFAAAIVEGVPGSGKTTLAHIILLACMYSSVRDTLRTVRQPEAAKILDDDDLDLDLSEPQSDDDDTRYNIRPVIPKSSNSNDDVRSSEGDRAKDEVNKRNQEVWSCYEIPPLAFGPTAAQWQYICQSVPADTTKWKEYCESLFTAIRDTYYHNFDRSRPSSVADDHAKLIRDKHWNMWYSLVLSAMRFKDEATCDMTPTTKTEEKAATTDDIRKEIASQAGQPKPANLRCNPQVMIIANQNTNGDDAAALMHKMLNVDLDFGELIIRVTNLQLESTALKRSFRPERDEGIRQAPGISDILRLGIQPEKLRDLTNRTGDFTRNKYGGIWKLENIMLRKLHDGHKPGLMRLLRRLGNPADILTPDETKILNKNIDDFMKEILDDAKVIICTFVVAQSLAHKELVDPTVVLVDEASRESELHVRWAQTAFQCHLFLLTGDHRQDKPFVNGQYDKSSERKNIHLNQLLTPLSLRVMAMRPDCVAFLAENRRQHGELQDLASDIFYEGNMRTIFDSRTPSNLTYAWYTFGQQLIHDMRALKTDSDLANGKVTEFLSGNRVALVCQSTMTTKGVSSVNAVQAQLSVEMAARIHQSHIPGSDMVTRPRICIITPYSAQVDEIKTRLRALSNKEVCHDLVEVRTQTAATGGEWDVVILCFVRDNKMAFLSEGNRINVMWTRSKYLSIDILDENFFTKPKGRNAKIMSRYSAYQALYGAYCKDLRNWGNICRRCYVPHRTVKKVARKDCDELACFFCESKGHHVRNCQEKGFLDPTINPDVINLPQQVIEKDNADGADEETGSQQGDGAHMDPPAAPETDSQDDDEPGRNKVKKPAEELDPDLKARLNDLLNNDTPEMLDMQPSTVAPEDMKLDESEQSEDEDEEDDQAEDSDDFNEFSTGKKTIKSRKVRRGPRKEKKGLWTKVYAADNDEVPGWGPKVEDNDEVPGWGHEVDITPAAPAAPADESNEWNEPESAESMDWAGKSGGWNDGDNASPDGNGW